MSVGFSWRRFIFFDKSFVSDRNTGEKYVSLKDVNIDSWSKSGDMAFLGERKGGIFRLTPQFQETLWKSFSKSLMDLRCAQGFLFSVGDDDDTGSQLKIWHKLDIDEPQLFKSVRFNSIHSGLASTVTCLGVHSLMSEVVAGFSDGTVLMFQGDVIRDKMDKNSRWLKICDSSLGEGPVEGVAVSHLPSDKTVVFVIFAKGLYSYVVENKNVTNKLKHFCSGGTRDCWAFNEKLGQLAVANKEMVYFYDAERSTEVDGGHGKCLQLDKGFEKMQVIWFGEYLVLLTKQNAIITAGGEKFMSVVNIFDIKNQSVVFSCSLPTICRMFILGSTLMVLNDKDGTLSELKEKPLSAKLDILFKKKLFDVALSLAKNTKEGKLHEQAIHFKYADYLYSKGDFDNAIDHYKGTIGMLEPSYVMKRFHDESRLHLLCIYLEALHEKKVHNKHQTEILLQTYARIGDTKKLLSFVKKISDFPETDIKKAFQILRSAGLSKEASLLAMQLKLPDEALVCWIEDLKQYGAAIKYLGNLSFETSNKLIEKYGKELIENSEEKFVHLLKTILPQGCEVDADVSSFLVPFHDQLAFNSEFLRFICTLPTEKIQPTIDRLLEIRLRDLTDHPTTNDQYGEILMLADTATPDVALQLVRIFRCLSIEHRVMITNKREKELAQFLLKHGQLKELISVCKSQNNPQIWVDTMVCIAQRQDITEEELRNFLKEVEDSEALHPLLILEILSSSNSIKISAVKPYIINWLQKQNAQIEKNTKAVEEAEKKMREITEQAESLKFEPQVIQVNKCSACDTGLQLPAIHFLCKHSFHLHCFESYSSDKADHCPACIIPQAIGQTEGTDTLLKAGFNKFHEQLNNSSNGMEIVAKFIRQGLFDTNKKTPARQSVSNPFSERQASDSGSSLASSRPSEGQSRRPTMIKSTNPFDEPSQQPARKALNPFDEAPVNQRPRGSNPFVSSNPFDE